jgi:hypothetical protein
VTGNRFYMTGDHRLLVNADPAATGVTQSGNQILDPAQYGQDKVPASVGGPSGG